MKTIEQKLDVVEPRNTHCKCGVKKDLYNTRVRKRRYNNRGTEAELFRWYYLHKCIECQDAERMEYYKEHRETEMARMKEYNNRRRK